MIILTDGLPHKVDKCRQAREILSSWGIEVIGMVLCGAKFYADTISTEKKKLDYFISQFDGCFDHYIVEGSAKEMISNGLKELNRILK